jgi:secreted Zn-dependent insulinase-like peptidase
MGSVEPIIEAIETPSIDKRTYCYVRLEYDLEALVIHDPITPEAGASMNVEPGSMSDEIQGMAHAVEHVWLLTSS